ncbi:aminopeptidase P family protein [Candidatus Dojkabacteria bacterium]|nr:aminopeptidase P family protein [Candidatus Dojkabacteria bacterium]
MWDQEAIQNHKKAAKLICNIKDECKKYIQENPRTTEFNVTNFILQKFKESKMQTDEPPMVAFRENTKRVHYIAPIKNSKKLRQESPIMIDLWAGLDSSNSPFADITWMFYFGKNPSKKILDTFKLVKEVRDHAIKFIQQHLNRKTLPIGSDIHKSIQRYIKQKGFEKNRNNYTGHSIGFTSPHGKYGNLNEGSTKELHINLGYTLEPELDFDDFGMRLELDFFIDSNYNLIITTDKQERLSIFQ